LSESLWSRDLVAEGRALIAGGRGAEAVEVFERAVFHDPADPEARQGLVDARAVADEGARLAQARLAEAEQAVAAGDTGRARRLADQALASGAPTERLLPLLDRLDPRWGRVRPSPSAPSADLPGQDDPQRQGSGGRRGLLVVAWALVLSLLGTGLAVSWEGLIGSLVERPEPATLAPLASPSMPPVTSGGQALAEARQLLESGDLAGALEVLDRVKPEEPAYPFARQLRGEAERALLARGFGER
jgi:hypothetical protein